MPLIHDSPFSLPPPTSLARMIRTSPETLAWRILVAAFAVFLLLCSAAVYAAQWYLFRSTVGMVVEVSAARGTVSVTPPDSDLSFSVTDRRSEVEPWTVISTDETSQATLTFTDPRTKRPVASVVAFRDSEIALVFAQAPRFGLNRTPYRIQIESHSGSVDVLVLEDLPREVAFEILSPEAFVRITDRGQYTLDVLEANTRMSVFDGEALVVGRDSGRSVTLADGERTTIGAAQSESLEIGQAEVALTTNYDFRQLFDEGWNFYNDREPPGTARNVIIDGRSAVMIDRSQSNWPNILLTGRHGETGLVQFLDTDVRGYSFLEVRVTFYVEEQSLSTCGTQGSECALMVKMKYLNPQEQPQEFIHGFYAFHDPSADYPTTCQTCRSDHERINIRNWYTYESGNLITQAPAQRPVHITELSVYASGWAYRIYVSEIVVRASR